MNSDQLCIILDGDIPFGSASNLVIADVVKQVEKQLVITNPASVCIDCTGLIYKHGDAIASIWIRIIRDGIPCRIIATGDTLIAIKSLVSHSSIPVTIDEPL